MTKLHRGLLLFLALPAVATGGTAALRAARAEPAGSTLCAYRTEDPGVESARQVIETLDGVVQARFSTIKQPFGISRMRSIDGHGNIAVLKPATSQEAAAMESVDSAEHNYLIAFLHCAHVPGTPARRTGLERPDLSALMIKDPMKLPGAAGTPHPFRPGVDDYILGPGVDGKFEQRIQTRAISALPDLRKGQSLEAMDGRWLIAMRPVKASSRSCLGCHAGARLGDTLGVMVYGVDTRPEGPQQQVQQ